MDAGGFTQQPRESCPTLYLNRSVEHDWLIALPFGDVDDGQPSENWQGVSESFGYLHRHPDGPVVGFKVLDFSMFDSDDPEVAEIWSGPRFDAPVLGLRSVPAGEIILAARVLFGDHPSVNREYFEKAVTLPAEDASMSRDPGRRRPPAKRPPSFRPSAQAAATLRATSNSSSGIEV